MQPPRAIVKRCGLWTAAIALLIVGYVAGAPFVIVGGKMRFPATAPAIHLVYSPVLQFLDHDGVPCSRAYTEYFVYCKEWTIAAHRPATE